MAFCFKIAVTSELDIMQENVDINFASFINQIVHNFLINAFWRKCYIDVKISYIYIY
jgi:hypothetical protein